MQAWVTARECKYVCVCVVIRDASFWPTSVSVLSSWLNRVNFGKATKPKGGEEEETMSKEKKEQKLLFLLLLLLLLLCETYLKLNSIMCPK